MSVSFQHLSLFPGVRLNFGISDISTTISEKHAAEKISHGLKGLKTLILEAVEEREPHEKKVRRAKRRWRRVALLSRFSQFYGVRIFMRPWIMALAQTAFAAEQEVRRAKTDLAA